MICIIQQLYYTINMFRQSALMPKVAMTEFLLRRQLGRAFAAAGYDATVDGHDMPAE